MSDTTNTPEPDLPVGEAAVHDGISKTVEAWDGFKTQLINRGWDAERAEMLVVESIKQARVSQEANLENARATERSKQASEHLIKMLFGGGQQ